MNNMNKEKVLIVLLGRYPTEKAYGVTTKNTIESLDSIGIETVCVSYPDFGSSELKKGFYTFREGKLALSLRMLSYRTFGILGKVCWKATTYLSLRQIPKMLENHAPTIVWIRDSRILNKFNQINSNAKLILEIHDAPTKKLIKNVCKIDPNRIILAPISKLISSQLSELAEKKYKIIFSPMGINPKLFSKKVNLRDLRSISSGTPIKIGYFGKLSPNGYSKGTEDLINLAIFHEEINFPSKFNLVGLSSSEVMKLSESFAKLGICDERFILEEHKPHQLAIYAMSLCDILFLPKQQSDTYVGSPIKGIEYAATGIPILAGISKANLSLFENSIPVFWYQSGNMKAMHESIISIIESDNLEENASISRNFAFERSWSLRCSKLVREIINLSSN